MGPTSCPKQARIDLTVMFLDQTLYLIATYRLSDNVQTNRQINVTAEHGSFLLQTTLPNTRHNTRVYMGIYGNSVYRKTPLHNVLVLKMSRFFFPPPTETYVWLIWWHPSPPPCSSDLIRNALHAQTHARSIPSRNQMNVIDSTSAKRTRRARLRVYRGNR